MNGRNAVIGCALLALVAVACVSILAGAWLLDVPATVSNSLTQTGDESQNVEVTRIVEVTRVVEQPVEATPAPEEAEEYPEVVVEACRSGLEVAVHKGVNYDCQGILEELEAEEPEGEPTPRSEESGEESVNPEAMTTQVGEWEILEIDLENDPIVASWIDRLRDPAPELWPTFPNVPNPEVPEFRVVNGTQVPDGAEYGEVDSPFCEQDQRCDWVVPGWHYRLITGDYSFTSEDFSYECRNDEGEDRKGCLILLFNVMDQTYTWRDQSVDNGFTVFGRYWNGDALEWAAWGLVSHASANMLNFPTIRDPNTGNVLNAGEGSANAGANCGVQPDACGVVDATIVVHAGDRILAVAQTTVDPTNGE